jgi:hypothetical protein
MINLKRVKILGAYVTVLGALQICFLLGPMFISLERYESRPDLWLWYFNPRIGLTGLESETIGIPIFTLVSAPWILALGLLLLSGRTLIRTYVISEIVLSAPNLLFVLWTLAVNMSPAHGFSVGE